MSQESSLPDFTWNYSADNQQLLFMQDASGRTFGVIDSARIGREEAERRANLFGASSNLLNALKTLAPAECPIVTHHSPSCGFCFALNVIAQAEGKEAQATEEES